MHGMILLTARYSAMERITSIFSTCMSRIV